MTETLGVLFLSFLFIEAFSLSELTAVHLHVMSSMLFLKKVTERFWFYLVKIFLRHVKALELWFTWWKLL